MRSSGGVIERPGLLDHGGAEVSAQVLGRAQVHPAPDELLEFEFDGGEPQQSGRATWLELHQQVEIAVGTQLPPECRAEQGQVSDPVSATQAPQLRS